MIMYMMAKLMVVIEGESRTEKWEVPRLGASKAQRKSVSPCHKEEPQSQPPFLLGRHEFDSANRASGCVLNDLSLDLAGCSTSPKSEWVMVAPVPVVFPRSGAGRPKKQEK